MSQLFLFQAGPVQEFIAQARSTRDLWSGSYLISWLMAHALKKVLELEGKVIFPVTEDQPLLRFLRSKPGDHQGNPAKILTPNLPNRFLATVPVAFKAVEIETAFQTEWGRISEVCWEWLQNEHPFQLETARELWTSQVERHWQLTWQLCQAHSWKDVGPIWAKTPLALDPKRPALIGSDSDNAWVADYEVLCHRLDARRQLRDFSAWATVKETLSHGKAPVWRPLFKDALSGKEDALGGRWGDKSAPNWFDSVRENTELKFHFRSAEPLGAVNLIKRIWHKAYLEKVQKLHRTRQALAFESVPGVAAAAWRALIGKQFRTVRPAALHFLQTANAASGLLKVESRVNVRAGFGAMDGALFHESMWQRQANGSAPARGLLDSARIALRDLRKAAGLAPAPVYYAVLALDGDEMGKWIGGQKVQASAAFHKDFGEALTHFGITEARAMVQRHYGTLIYSGGDDVLAMLPADEAIPCAQALSKAFGDAIAAKAKSYPWVEGKPHSGTVSAGIAIGHMKEPLQDMVAAAQAAEKRAKSKPLDRNALAVTLFKRSGEIIEWGAKFDSKAFELLRVFREHYRTKLDKPEESPLISRRFPHQLASLLQPYQDFETRDRFPDPGHPKPLEPTFIPVVMKEFEHIVSRQAKDLCDDKPEDRKRLVALARSYLDELAGLGVASNLAGSLRDFSNLFLLEAFLQRQQDT